MKKFIKHIAPALLMLFLSNHLTAAIAIPNFLSFGSGLNSVDEVTPAVSTLTITDNLMFTDDTLQIAISIGVPYADNLTVSIEHNGFSAILYQGAGNGALTTIDATFMTTTVLSLGFAPTTGIVNGDFAPLESLSIFNGISLQGNWNLSISDQSGNPNDGTDLLAWSIGADIPAPASLALFIIGMTGFVSRKKV